MNSFSWDTTGVSSTLDAGESPDFQSEGAESPISSFSYPIGTVVGLTKRNLHSTIQEPNYPQLVRKHRELIWAGKSAEYIASWTGEKLGISSWKQGKFYGKRGALPTPKPAEAERFQKFIEALGIQYTSANGPSKGQPKYFLLDGFVQNKWLGEENMKKIYKELEGMNTYWSKKGINNKERAKFLLDQIDFDMGKKLSRINIGYRSANNASGYDRGLWIGGSFYHDKEKDGVVTKMVNALGIIGEEADLYNNTAATGRMCFVR